MLSLQQVPTGMLSAEELGNAEEGNKGEETEVDRAL